MEILCQYADGVFLRNVKECKGLSQAAQVFVQVGYRD